MKGITMITMQLETTTMRVEKHYAHFVNAYWELHCTHSKRPAQQIERVQFFLAGV